MQYKLIVTDIDGTLLDDNHGIPAGNLEALKKANEMGISVALCSGRSQYSINIVEDRLGLEKVGNYGAGYHGCVIYKADTREVVQNYRIDKKIIAEIMELLKEDSFSYLIHDDMKLYTFEEDERTKYYEERCNDTVEVVTFEELNDTVSKLIILGDNEKLKEFEKRIPEEISNKCKHFFASNDLYEFINKDASKGNALKYLCEKLGIDQKETIGFGDNFNDMELIQEAGLGVAVANAVPELKEVADYVTERNNGEGAIEEVLNKFVFNK